MSDSTFTSTTSELTTQHSSEYHSTVDNPVLDTRNAQPNATAIEQLREDVTNIHHQKTQESRLLRGLDSSLILSSYWEVACLHSL